jgi:hypothetical protein
VGLQSHGADVPGVLFVNRGDELIGAVEFALQVRRSLNAVRCGLGPRPHLLIKHFGFIAKE